VPHLDHRQCKRQSASFSSPVSQKSLNKGECSFEAYSGKFSSTQFVSSPFNLATTRILSGTIAGEDSKTKSRSVSVAVGSGSILDLIFY
jgi:hypothetical protein